VPKGRLGLLVGLAVAAVLVLAGGGYYFTTSQSPAPEVASVPAASAEAEKVAQEQAELARLRAEAATREKAGQEAALRRQVEEEVRRKMAAEAAEKKRVEEQVRQKAEAEAAAKRKPEEDERKVAEAAEAALQLGKIDRQNIQVALVTLGFGISLLDGTLANSREMIAGWQKARSQPVTGFLTGPQNQALLQEAAQAVSKFDDQQKKIEEERKKAAAGMGPVNPDIVPLENNKRFVLYLASGTSCDATAGYVAQVFANKLDIQFRGGWQTFAANSAGDFGRSFTNPVSRNVLSVKGNLKTRLVSVENQRGCLWKGSF
jgi:hypothetical protein